MLVSELGLDKYIQFPGFRNDIARVLPNIDIVAHPAYTEGLGVTLLESGACSIPIVAGAAGGIPEVVIDGKNGFLFTPGNADELRERLETLLAATELRLEFAEEARRHVENNFSVSAMAKGNLAVYHELLNTVQ